jgi:protoporphyrinogen oxidase
MTKVVVLGAGVTGMCAALHLKESSLARELDVTILEQESRPGGLLQSTYLHDYWWDNGAFFFHYPQNYLVRRLPGLFESIQDFGWHVWLRGKFYTFPFRLREMISMLNPLELMGAGLEFAWNDLLTRPPLNPPDLRHWLDARLPRILVRKTNLETYIAKLQGFPLDQLSPKLGVRRLGEIRELADASRVLQIVRRQLAGARTDGRQRVRVTCNTGVGTISRCFAELCRSRGVTITCDARVQEVERRAAGDFGIQVQTPAGRQTLNADYVISTIPLARLAEIFTPRISVRNLENADQLRHMNIRLVFLIINQPKVKCSYYTLYSFMPEHCWKRLVARSLPNGQTSILVELAFEASQPDPGPEAIPVVIRDLADEIGLFRREDVALAHTALQPYAYPIYEPGFDTRSNEIMDEIRSTRLLTIGRQGTFRYDNTPDNAPSGVLAARRIIQDIRNRK